MLTLQTLPDVVQSHVGVAGFPAPPPRSGPRPSSCCPLFSKLDRTTYLTKQRMARTKQTARKSSGGKAPRKMLATKSAGQLRQYLTGRQAATYASAKPSEQKKTSYIVSSGPYPPTGGWH